MFFDVWTAYKQVCGGATLTKEGRLTVLQQLEDRIRESERKRFSEALRNAMQDHYWDSLEPNREVVMAHVDGVLKLFDESFAAKRSET